MLKANKNRKVSKYIRLKEGDVLVSGDESRIINSPRSSCRTRWSICLISKQRELNILQKRDFDFEHFRRPIFKKRIG